MNAVIEEKLKLLPSSPGVYKMFNAAGEVIYVGKAISLKNRVRQYFQSSKAHTAKVTAMVSHIENFETIQVHNETEALSLESNLIKEFMPKYNILLKDDKHFPYVRIDLKQDFPRVEVVRRVARDGAKYLGPYLSAINLRDSLAIVRDHYPVRHCRKDLARAMARRERPCLMYHVGKCCAPCSGNVSRETYHAMLDEIMSFLSGNTDEILKTLYAGMEEASEALEFEHAALLRDRIKAIESLSEKQTVISTSNTRMDVFALGRLGANAIVFALFVRDGKVIGTEPYRMGAGADEADGDVLAAFLAQYYADALSVVPEILVYQEAADMEGIEKWLSEIAGRKVILHRPERGDKRKLTELAYRNCIDLLSKDATLQKRAWERGEGALSELATLLSLPALPERMECYDNSHMQGRDTVSSMVVFTGGQPDKKAYRRFRVKAEAGGDDLIAMRECLTRRLDRAEAGDAGFLPLPDLLIVDGGKTQLAVAVEVLSEHALDYIPAIGLAEAHELVYQPNEELPLELPQSSASLHLIERIRDEAHRFAITYHRSLRQKRALFSVLDGVPGVGEKRKRALFDAFETLDDMKKAPKEALAAVPGIGPSAAEAIYAFFRAKEPDTDTPAAEKEAGGKPVGPEA